MLELVNATFTTGHTKKYYISTTQRYIDVNAEQLSEAVELL